MSIQRITKKRLAAAAAILSIGGAGLALSGFGVESSTLGKAGKAGTPGEQQAAAVTTASDDAINGAGVRLVARRTGLGRFTIERATSANGWLTGTAMAQGSAVTGAAIDTATNESNDEADRPRRLRVPRKVEVGLPRHEGGRLPSATAPSVDPGTAPSVEPGWTTTIDLGEAPHAGSPSVDPGDMGTIHPPTVEGS